MEAEQGDGDMQHEKDSTMLVLKMKEEGYYGLKYSPPNSYTEVLTPVPQNMSEWEIGLFKRGLS